MAKQLAYVLINPYTIAKSRTGGVIARYMGRSQLDLVAARMFGPSQELVERYAEMVRWADADPSGTGSLIADYILKSYAPDPASGRPRRVMLLLFEGEDAVRRVWEVTGSSSLRSGSGESVRDTYGDYVRDGQGQVQYFEPAVLVAPNPRRAAASLRLWATYSERDGGVVASAADVPEGPDVEQTLVLLKPDNFRFKSFRPGNIIDVLSRSGLRIVGIKKMRMTVDQAERFYHPVRESLRGKFLSTCARRAAHVLSEEFHIGIAPELLGPLSEKLAPMYAAEQFENIVHFMTGYKPSHCMAAEKSSLGREDCVALVYRGCEAIRKIRALVGPTDPSKAEPGSVRREYGSDVMVNACHASDSAENAAREMEIIKPAEDTIVQWVDRHYGGVSGRVLQLSGVLPRVGKRVARRLKTQHEKHAQTQQ